MPVDLYLKALESCSHKGLVHLLVTLYHIAQCGSSRVLEAEQFGEPAQSLACRVRAWRGQLRKWQQPTLTAVDPHLLCTRLRWDVVAAPSAEELGLHLWALLRALDALPASREALAAFAGEAVTVDAALPSPATYHVLPRPENPLHISVPERRRFRHAELALDDLLERLLFVRIPADRRFRLVWPNPELTQRLLARRDTLQVGVFPLCRDMDFSFDGKPGKDDGVEYIFAGMDNENTVWEEVRTILEICRGGVSRQATPAPAPPVAVVVFPELSVTPRMERQISTWLRTENRECRILLVAAGSFHRRDLLPGPRPTNTCRVWQYDGQVAYGQSAGELYTPWCHHKMNRFTVTQADLDRLRQDPAPRFARFRGLFPQGISHAIEAIQTQHPPEVLLFDLPIGRAAVVICLDYIVPADREFLRDLGVTLLFVPAMSPTLKRFGNTSDPVLAEKHYCSVFCANGAWVVPDGHEATAASYVWLPAKDGRRTLADTPCRPPLLRAPLRRSGLQPGRTARP